MQPPEHSVENGLPRWSAQPDRYVVCAVDLGDGTAYFDLYTRNGECVTLSDDIANAALAAEMIAAGVEVVDYDAWVGRWRELMNHSLLWTRDRFQYVISRSAPPEIYTMEGTIYPVAPYLLKEVIERMVASGARAVPPEKLQATLVDLRHTEEREVRRCRRCFMNDRVPRAWLRHRIDSNDPGNSEPVPDREQMREGDYLFRSTEGRVPFTHVAAFHSKLLQKLGPGDELWWFRNPRYCWGLSGVAGYCIVRPGRPITDYSIALRS